MFHKITLVSFFGVMLFVGCLGLSNNAHAASTCTPTIKVQETKETSVKLKATCLGLKKTKVSMRILVNNDDDDSDFYKTVNATLGKSGSVSLKIGGLDSATSYSFKVKIKKASSSLYSSYSSSVSTTTKGSDYQPEIKKINGITDDSVKLNISCDDLESKMVDVQVAYQKKSSWSTKTFSLTLDDDGEGSITMNGLKSDTLYTFKIKIKKNDHSTYSTYSSIKTVTTDED
jgi:hypothetical protein